MTTTTKTPKVHVVLRRPHPVPSVLALAKAISSGMAANVGTFPKPTPPLVVLDGDVSALDTAETATHTRTKGAAQARDAKLAIVVVDLNLLRSYVEAVANADPANASTIASSAGMSLRKQPTTTKNDLNVKPSKVSGSVSITARVGTKQKVSHEWEYSVDGGKTWLAMPPTVQAKTTLTGLMPGSTVQFRHRAVTLTGPADWGTPVPMIVT
jgi:hypothetical protein